MKLPGMTLLFVDKMFLRPGEAPLRGVELFNLHLVRDLMALDYDLLFLCERSWEAKIRAELGDGMPELLSVAHKGSDAINALCAIPGLLNRRFDHFLIGNVGNGMIPLIRSMIPRAENTVLIAHREAKPKFVRACRKAAIVAVNEQIAVPFRAAACPVVRVDYGIMNAEAFFPGEGATDGKVRFCVLGMLDNAWKGSDTAIAAFRALPQDVKAGCELHLASFSEPGEFEGEPITAYGWMHHGRIPEFLRGMDVLLVPSRDEDVMRETFSQVTVQGMLSGLPVLAAALPILAEKLDQGGGRVYTSVEALTARMQELAESPELRQRLGDEARAVALKRYVWDSRRFAESYLGYKA